MPTMTVLQSLFAIVFLQYPLSLIWFMCEKHPHQRDASFGMHGNDDDFSGLYFPLFCTEPTITTIVVDIWLPCETPPQWQQKQGCFTRKSSYQIWEEWSALYETMENRDHHQSLLPCIKLQMIHPSSSCYLLLYYLILGCQSKNHIRKVRCMQWG